MFAKPSVEHNFFAPLVGQWTLAHQCDTGNGQPQISTTGQATIRSLGGMWYIIECSWTGDENQPEPWSSQFTLGYDPEKKAYVGTFVGSMMTHLWIYQGQLDESGKSISLNVEGPRFDGPGTALYRDTIEIVSEDHWILRSALRNDDGSWNQFMEGHHHRVK